MVYSNRAIDELSITLPSTLEDLTKITGLGPKKVDLFGKDILEVINKHREESTSPELVAKLKSIRTRIMKFNHIEDKDDVFTDDAILEMLLTRPKTSKDLATISGVKHENLSLFGDYLVNKMLKLH
jgi:superfamily II DNA helicase RecQ